MVRVALLGCGTMGKTHAQAYTSLKDVEVAAVCDIRKEKADSLAMLSGCMVFTSYETLSQEAHYDVLDICLPTYLHAQYAIQAMREGKHVFCEKPIALNLEDAQEMIDAATHYRVKFSVGHVLRFFPQYSEAVRQIEAGRIGTPRLLRTSRNQGFPGWSWENWYQNIDKSGGPEVDLAIHDYDWLLHNFGPVSRVYAKNLGSSHSGQMHTLAILRFANGAMAHVEASWAMPRGSEFRTGFELVGTEGQLCYDSSRDCPLKIQLTGEDEDSLFSDNPLPDHLNPYRAELASFMHAVQNDLEPVVTAQEAMDALRVALATKESAQTGNAVNLEEMKI